MIILANDPGVLSLDVGPGAICVRHHDYPTPSLGTDCEHVLYEQFHCGLLEGKRTMVVAGLSRILTPANRTRVGPLMLRPLPGIRRLSIDRTLFIVEPWRAWWHFGCVGAKYMEFTYSYLAESRWKAAQEGRGVDPFSLVEFGKWGEGVIESKDVEHFSDVTTSVLAVGAETERDYQALKARCFDEEHTPAAIIKRLSDFAQAVCPDRSIPAPSQLFRNTRHHMVATNLGVDRWLTGQLRGLVELTNGIARRFYRGGN